VKLARPAARARGVEVLPLIDLIFLLLAAFVYATQALSEHRALPLELPAAASGRTERGRHLAVTVTRGGTVYLQGEEVSMEQLGAEVRARLAAEPELRFTLDADRRADYGQAVRVLDALHAAGARSVRLSVRGTEGPGAGAPPDQ
jgi:biopolymer transport protein ExbD